ncbi:MAG: hypothetical protein MJ248_02030 [Bacilli bacterium]|nr:hypothetical protein [Bacilli bacterium]
MEEALKPTKEAPQIINVFPISKGKRVLLFLADFFICFIISFVLYNVVAFPTWYSIIKYDDIQEKANEAERNRNSILYQSNLIYFEDYSRNHDDISEGLSYTFDLMMKEYVSSDLVRTHDVFYTYYTVNKDSINEYVNGYSTFGDSFFDIDELNVVTLKPALKELFLPILSAKDGLSEVGTKKYEEVFNDFFLTFYSRVMNELNKNDLVVNNISYKVQQLVINDANKKFDSMVLGCTFIAFLLSILLNYLVVPMFNQYHKTIGMLMMKIHRINIDSMKILNKPQCAGLSIYNIFTHMGYLSLIPIITINIEYIFNLTLTLWLGVSSILIVLVSLIVLLFSKTNQSLTDSITRTAYISNDSLDEIFRSRGYYI